MKKLILGSLVLSSVLFADNTEDFFYNRGYETGYNKGFDEGVKKAFIEAEKVLLKYKDELKAYEIGKYLIRKRYLTAPKIYQNILDDGGMKINVQQSEFIKELSIKEIFEKFSSLPVMQNKKKDTNNEIDIDKVNSVNLADRDNLVNLPAQADKNNKIISIVLPKNYKNKEILEQSNLVYSIDKNKFKVMFFSVSEKNNFCNSFKICK